MNYQILFYISLCFSLITLGLVLYASKKVAVKMGKLLYLQIKPQLIKMHPSEISLIRQKFKDDRDNDALGQVMNKTVIKELDQLIEEKTRR